MTGIRMQLCFLAACCALSTGYARGADSFTVEEVRQLVEKHEGGSLHALEHLEELPDAIAAELGRFKGTFLNLNGVKRLSDNAAHAVGQAQCLLSLNGLHRLSDNAAKSLGAHDGKLILGGLTRLSDEAAEGLSQHRCELVIPRAKGLSERALISLANVEGGLWLDAQETISVKAAEALSHNEHGLMLPGVYTISDEAAAALANFRGNTLYLINLTHTCVEAFSSETLAALRANRSIRGWFMNEK